MAKRIQTFNELSLAESGALVLAEAAADLDRASDAPTFLRALDRNRRIWQALSQLARERIPARVSEYALSTTRKAGKGVNDDHVNALITINRTMSAELSQGDDLDSIRRRAHHIWESHGRPHGQDLEHWLLAEMEHKAGGGH
jgi:hypothetical protein